MRRSEFLTAAAAATATSVLLGVTPAAAATSVSVLYAGSLVTLMERGIKPAFDATGYDFQGEAKGSTALANLIKAGLRSPDVFVSADTAAVESLRGPGGNDAARWYAAFATTRLQIAYSRKSKFAADFARAAAGTLPWYELLQRPGIKIARTDPAQDPKGYRVLLAMQLAEAFYKKPGLAKAVLGDAENLEQVLLEESALARLETGEVDALWAYALESVSRGLPAIALPPQIDLGSPSESARYATATVSVGEKTYIGSPILYALTVPTAAKNPDAGAAFVRFFLGPQGVALQTKAGLTPTAPKLVGDRAALPPALAGLF